MLDIEIKGVPQAQRFLDRTQRVKFNRTNIAIHNAGLVVEREVKLSIAGRKVEKRSVDTGRFLNSVTTDNTRKLISQIMSNVNYARFLEFGTTRLAPRRHFSNTLARNRSAIIDSIQRALR